MRVKPVRICVLLAAFAGTGFAATPPEPSVYEPPQPSATVSVARYEWHDAARDREVPVKMYYPAKNSGPCPIIIFSHGLGGSREGYEYLGKHWAGCGYVCVHIQHLGSDEGVWKNVAPLQVPSAMARAAAEPSNAMNRVKDVKFTIDQTIGLNTTSGSPLEGRLDTKHIGMAGHSFGAWTTMAAVGELIGPRAIEAGDPRITAAIEMSAPVPVRPAERERAFTKISVPVFHMTGTRDDSPIGETRASERRIPFDQMSSAETCLVIFKDADHMTFSGRARAMAKADDDRFHALICAAGTAFWDAYLRGDSAAKAWLYDGGFEKLLGASGTFEKKLPK